MTLSTKRYYPLFIYAGCHYAECHYDECHYAECHYAECHYAECRGAFKNTHYNILKEENALS